MRNVIRLIAIIINLIIITHPNILNAEAWTQPKGKLQLNYGAFYILPYKYKHSEDLVFKYKQIVMSSYGQSFVSNATN